MAITRSDIPDLLVPGLKTEFELAYRSELEDSLADRIATVVNTTMPAQKYGWLGSCPPMREFIGERRPSGMASYAVTIEDKVFESTIAVDRKALEDDQLGLLRLRIRDLAGRVAQHRHQITVGALAGGATATCYDGTAFFGSAHPVGGGTAFNLSSAALSNSSLAEAMATMMGYTDDQAVPLGIVPDTLVVGPSLMWDATELVESPVVVFKPTSSAGRPATNYVNALQGRLKLVVTPFLSGADAGKWFLLDTKRAIKGVILQQREDIPVEFTAVEATGGSESAFMRDRYLYGVRARYNVGYGLWQAAYVGGAS